MSDRREKADIAFELTSAEYELMNDIFTRGMEMYDKASEIPPAVEKQFPSCGISLGLGVDQMRHSLSAFYSLFSEFTETFKNNDYERFKKICESRIAKKKEGDEMLAESEGHDKNLVDQTVKRHKSLSDAVTKLNDFVRSIQGKQKIPTRQLAQNYWAQYVQRLSDFISEREALKRSTDTLEVKMARHVDALEDYENDAKTDLCNNVFIPIVAGLDQMGKKVSDIADDIGKKCVFDFESDFEQSLKETRIRFCDDEMPKFERYKFSSKYNQPDRLAVPEFKVEYFPVAAATATCDFTPEGAGEVPLKKGRRVFLMEEPAEDWTLVMTCGWGRIGFVPTSHIEKSEGQFAVVNMKTFRPPEGSTFCSTHLPFVVLKEQVRDGVWLCEDELFNTAEVAAADLVCL